MQPAFFAKRSISKKCGWVNGLPTLQINKLCLFKCRGKVFEYFQWQVSFLPVIPVRGVGAINAVGIAKGADFQLNPIQSGVALLKKPTEKQALTANDSPRGLQAWYCLKNSIYYRTQHPRQKLLITF
jgi:hypothetical protein